MRRVLVPLSLSPVLPAHGSVLREASGATMGTSWSVRAAVDGGMDDQGWRETCASLQRQLDIVVAQMSHWESASDLSLYNDAAPGTWRHLPSAFFKVLHYALGVADASGGAYDPCAGALVNCWGFGARRRYDQAGFYAPRDSAIAAILARRDRSRIELDINARKAMQPGGVQLDLSSVAKGYAVDQLAQTLNLHGIGHFVVEVGGELRGAGVKPDGQPWWVALEAVPGSQGAQETVVALHGLSVATSGDYRRFYDHGGVRASHTLDPRTGRPIANDVASVTVLHPDCMCADALSTAMSVLGPDEGLAFAETKGLAARFLLRRPGGLREVSSTAFNDMLQ